MKKFVTFLISIIILLITSFVFADDSQQLIAKEAVFIIKNYEKAYMSKNLNKMLEYVDQNSDWFKEGFVEEVRAIFRTFTNINLYHFKYSRDTSLYYVYPAEGGIFVGQNTLSVAYSRTLSDLNEFTEFYSLKKVEDTYKIDGVKHTPYNEVEFIDKGTGAMLENKVDEAISYFKKVVESNPENSVAHCRLGMIYSRIGKNREALQELKKAVGLRPNVGFYRFYLSQVLYTLGEKEKAAQEMKKALELDAGLNIFFTE